MASRGIAMAGAGPAAASERRAQIARELLAMGFPGRRVAAAVLRCGSVEEAVDMLRREAGGADGATTTSVEPQASAPAAPEGTLAKSPEESVEGAPAVAATPPDAPAAVAPEAAAHASGWKWVVDCSERVAPAHQEASPASLGSAEEADPAGQSTPPSSAQPQSGAKRRRLSIASPARAGSGWSQPASSSRKARSDVASTATAFETELEEEEQGHRMSVETVTCSICTEDCGPWCAVQLPCSHGWYCLICIQRHTEARLQVGAHVVNCPECNVVLSEAVLRAVLPPRIIERLLKRSLEQAVVASADVLCCPTPDCPNKVFLEGDQEPRLECTLCGEVSCLRCQVKPYHEGLTCEEHAAAMRAVGSSDGSEELLKWLRRTGSRQCPTCKIAITKEDLDKQRTQKSECHKMLCRNCGTKFCFKCQKVLTDTFTCRCTPVEHGFIDPESGDFVAHNLRKASDARGRGKGKRSRGRAPASRAR